MHIHDEEEQQEIAADEERVELDSLQKHIMGSREEVSEVAMPLAGWALAVLVILDTVGNVLGVPVVTGALLSATQEPTHSLAVVAFIFQLAGAVGAGLMLYKSHWRFWWRTLLMGNPQNPPESRGNVHLGEKFRSLRTKLASKGRTLKEDTRNRFRKRLEESRGNAEDGEEGEEAGSSPQRWPWIHAAMPLVLIVLGFASIVLLWPAGILAALMVACIALATYFLLDVATELAGALWARIKTSYGSMMGVCFGIGAAVACYLLFGAGNMLVYSRQVWIGGHYFPFRLLQLFILCGIVILLRAQRRVELKHFRFYRATRPAAAQPKTCHVFDFTGVAAQPACLSLDAEELPYVVVLARHKGRCYEIVDRSSRLPLMSRVFTVLNLDALQTRIGTDWTEVRGNGDTFLAKARFTVTTTSLDSLCSSATSERGGILLPKHLVSIFLKDLFRTETPRALLDQLLRDALDEHSVTGEDTACASLPERFQQRLRDHFVNAVVKKKASDEEARALNEAVDCLLACAGVMLEIAPLDLTHDTDAECEDVVIRIDPEPEAAPEADSGRGTPADSPGDAGGETPDQST